MISIFRLYVLFAFVSTLSFSQNIKNYYTSSIVGDDAYTQCLKQKQNIEKIFKIHEKTEASIIHIECKQADVKDGDKLIQGFRVEVLYSDSYAFKIKNMVSYYATQELCLDAQTQYNLNANFISLMQNNCLGSQTRYVHFLDYVDVDKYSFEEYNISQSWLDESACRQALPQLKKSFTDNEYKVVLSQCALSRMDWSDKKIYRTKIHYFRPILDKYYVNNIEGESFLDQSKCVSQLGTLQLKFVQNGFPVLQVFCNNMFDKFWNIKISIKDNFYFRPLKNLDSKESFDTLENCQMDLNILLGQLNRTSDFDIVYPFCQQSYKKWKHIIYYKKNIEI